MNFRLVHQLSLLVLVSTALAVLAMAGVVAWNLRAGFSDYLRAQDGQMLDRLMVLAEQDLSQRRSRDGVLPERWQPVLRQWLDGSLEQRGGQGEGPPPDDARPPPPPRFGPRHDGPPPRPPRPPGDPNFFAPRIVLLDANGERALAGHPEVARLPGQQRALKLDGQTVLILRLAERAGPAQGVDASFLRRQYWGLGGMALLVIALALLAARVLAARWVRPLQQAQAATRRIARGELKVRIAKQGDDELGALTDDINAMAEALARLESSRRRWIAELSHELRTPLAVLRAELEALQDGVRPLEKEALGSLQDEVQRLSRLTEDFHTLAISELQELPCNFTPTELTALLAEALARIRSRAQVAGLALQADWPAQLPLANWDGERIAQMLANLLENSLRYTDAPGLLKLSARLDGDSLEICLDDSKPGVPAEALAHLFEPLYRVDASRSRQAGGSGLGLGVAQAIARSHGGKLVALPSDLGGLKLSLALPLQARQPPQKLRRPV
ncbi:ATP-binding protein [Roseateles oligotrophus]|uniref:Signal transduction histidine-protein kinase/phosphatase MprB n=1 Tax=Roseateles oligotrophus TaxID=1769250 RepID=A0ABT2YH67_9BURK|nr:ATP-binding protein [Roseateles oligotrophus]MCV2369409.1 HAMP domain-containing protein [Roseateles oligotrophus]